MSARVVASLAIATRMDQCMGFASSTAAWGNAARRRPRGTARTRAAPLRQDRHATLPRAGRSSQAIAEVEAMTGNAARLVRAPTLCLCKAPGEEGPGGDATRVRSTGAETVASGRKEPRAARRRSATHGDRRPGGLSIATIGAFVLMRCEGENAR
jgi:hypothetical protein